MPVGDQQQDASDGDEADDNDQQDTEGRFQPHVCQGIDDNFFHMDAFPGAAGGGDLRHHVSLTGRLRGGGELQQGQQRGYAGSIGDTREQNGNHGKSRPPGIGS